MIKLQCPVTVPSRVQIATEKQVDYLKQKMVTVPSRVQIATVTPVLVMVLPAGYRPLAGADCNTCEICQGKIIFGYRPLAGADCNAS